MGDNGGILCDGVRTGCENKMTDRFFAVTVLLGGLLLFWFIAGRKPFLVTVRGGVDHVQDRHQTIVWAGSVAEARAKGHKIKIDDRWGTILESIELFGVEVWINDAKFDPIW